MFRALRWLAILAVIGLLAWGGRTAYDAGWPRLKPPSSTVVGVITDQARSNWDQTSDRLTVTLKRIFPVGLASHEVRVRLLGQGFQPLRECPDVTLHKVQGSQDYACSLNWDPDHALHYNWGPRSPCQQDVAVFWSDDGSGHITSIQGQYSCS